MAAVSLREVPQVPRVGMILDVTHLSDQSFFEALERFGGPVMASHNNCRALVPADRQFAGTGGTGQPAGDLE